MISSADPSRDATPAMADVDSEDQSLSPAARWLGSDIGVSWVKRIALGLVTVTAAVILGYALGARTVAIPSNAVDAGFLEDMTSHHEQAVEMAITEIANGSDPVAKGFAMEVIMFQRLEIGLFMAYQAERGLHQPTDDPQRNTMSWMGMPTELRDMPGMATDAQLEELKQARGTEADILFLELMKEHHLGGAHMGDFAAQNAADPKIKTLAERIANNQRLEVTEYQSTIDRLRGALLDITITEAGNDDTIVKHIGDAVLCSSTSARQPSSGCTGSPRISTATRTCRRSEPARTPDPSSNGTETSSAAP